MNWAAISDWWRDLDTRRKIALWSVALGLICGITDIGKPIENGLLSIRNLYANRQASGRIVVVGIDERSIAEVGQWPWPRRNYALLLDKLRAAGAKNVFFDIAFRAPTNDDPIFADALRRAGARATIAASILPDAITDRDIEVLPAPLLQNSAKLGGTSYTLNFLGQPNPIQALQTIRGQQIPAFSALIAGKAETAPSRIRTDYGIAADSVPVVSALDVLRGTGAGKAVRGRNVVIGVTVASAADLVPVPRARRIPSTYLHVLAAETLLRGSPFDVGFLAPLVLCALTLLASIKIRQPIYVYISLLAALSLFVTIPLIFERHLIFVDIFPSIVTIITAIFASVWMFSKAALERQAQFNQLSGLSNFNALRVSEVERDSGLVAVRIGNFSEVVSSLNEQEERALIHQIAGRLAIGGADLLYQGDDGIFAFSVSAEDMGGIGEQLDALHGLFRASFKVNRRAFDLRLSFGVVAADDRPIAARLSSALVAADEAAASGLRWQAFDRERLADAEWRLSLLGQLDAAIGRNEIWIAFQPKLNLISGRIDGAEALVRWQHPVKGNISPDEFIRAAEQHGRIDRLTLFVLEQAIRNTANLKKSKSFKVAVNVSTRLLQDPRFVTQVELLLERYVLPAERLILEITETGAISDNSIALETLQRLRALGTIISIDDYGTGHSNLEYLRSIPSDEIKIDQGFVRGLIDNHADEVLVTSTIELARSLGRRVVAEGVEDNELLERLIELQCDGAQGYLIGKPVRWDDLIPLIGSRFSRRTNSSI